MSLQRHVAVVLCHTGQDVAKILPQAAQAEQKPSFCELRNDEGGWFFHLHPWKLTNDIGKFPCFQEEPYIDSFMVEKIQPSSS